MSARALIILLAREDCSALMSSSQPQTYGDSKTVLCLFMDDLNLTWEKLTCPSGGNN
jgi:hypothetical protein